MKYLIMCEGPNELEVIRMLLEYNKLIFTEDDLLNLVPYHARQISKSAAVKTALNLYPGEVIVLRIGDKLGEELKIPKEYDFEKVKSSVSPKTFSKKNIMYNRTRYNNSTAFYREYYGERIELLVDTIKRYKQLKGKHQKDEYYLADLLK